MKPMGKLIPSEIPRRPWDKCVSEFQWHLVELAQWLCRHPANFAQDTWISKSISLTFIYLGNAKFYARIWLKWRDSHQACIPTSPRKHLQTCLTDHAVLLDCESCVPTLVPRGRSVLTLKQEHHCHFWPSSVLCSLETSCLSLGMTQPTQKERAILQPCVEWLQASRIYFQMIWRSKRIVFLRRLGRE